MSSNNSGLISAGITRRPPMVGGGLRVVGRMSAPFGGLRH
jgi:hypothetical protein